MPKCKVCKTKFDRTRPLQNVCSYKCAAEKGRRQREKAFKARTRELKAKAKTRGDWLKEAQTAFNKFIRFRDNKEPCISCGTRDTSLQYAGGHYRTVGACPELRFEEDNCHKQCNKNCNKELSGNITEYRINLVKKIGVERVEWIEGPHDPLNLSIDDIKETKAKYTKKAKDIQNKLEEI